MASADLADGVLDRAEDPLLVALVPQHVAHLADVADDEQADDLALEIRRPCSISAAVTSMYGTVSASIRSR
jgi:hypothetical protein